MAKKKPPVLEFAEDGEDIYILFDGLTIAKRGLPGTLQARTWVSLEPGYSVSDGAGGRTVEVIVEDATVH